MIISVYFLIFFALVVGGIFAAIFVWAVKANQFKDIEAPKYEMLRDDDEYEDDDELNDAAEIALKRGIES